MTSHIDCCVCRAAVLPKDVLWRDGRPYCDGACRAREGKPTTSDDKLRDAALEVLAFLRSSRKDERMNVERLVSAFHQQRAAFAVELAVKAQKAADEAAAREGKYGQQWADLIERAIWLRAQAEAERKEA